MRSTFGFDRSRLMVPITPPANIGLQPTAAEMFRAAAAEAGRWTDLRAVLRWETSMRSLLALMVVATVCIQAQVNAQTNPLWSEQKVKNFLPHMTWPEVRDLLNRTDMVLIPIPALEQHGLQGPIGTDYYTGIEQSKLIAQRTEHPRRAHPLGWPVALSPCVSWEHCLIVRDSPAGLLRGGAKLDRSGIPTNPLVCQPCRQPVHREFRGGPAQSRDACGCCRSC